MNEFIKHFFTSLDIFRLFGIQIVLNGEARLPDPHIYSYLIIFPLPASSPQEEYSRSRLKPFFITEKI